MRNRKIEKQKKRKRFDSRLEDKGRLHELWEADDEDQNEGEKQGIKTRTEQQNNN